MFTQRHFALLLCIFTASTLRASTHYVNLNSTNPISPFSSWATAATNIQDAIDAATNGDTVLVTNGVYQTGGRKAPFPSATTNRVIVDKPLTVQSVNGPDFTVIKGYQVPDTTNGVAAIRCVYLTDGSMLTGFTLTGGATYQVSDFGDNRGGGASCTSTNAVLSNCRLIGNTAYIYGGGANGGTLVNCLVASNWSAWMGGGASYCNLTNCVLTGNSAFAMAAGANNCNMVNCTVTGGTIEYYYYGRLGGGTYGGTLNNCIVYYNFGGPGGEDVYGSTLNHTCTPAATGPGNIANPPLFVDRANGNLHLQAVSPCIDAGSNTNVVTATDLDGKPRIVAGTVDLGAYEFQGLRHYVNLTATNPVPPYSTWFTAATNIQDAIDAATNGDAVIVTNGVYQTGGRVVPPYTLTNRVVVDKPITVQSVNGSSVTTIRGCQGVNPGDNPIRCVYLANGSSLIGFIITGGGTLDVYEDYFESTGAGVWAESTNSYVSACNISSNYALTYAGGGVTSGTLDNCYIAENLALYFGGGAYQSVLKNCQLVHNIMVNSGASAGAEQCDLYNCLLSNNYAGSYGGGAGWSTLSNCVVIGNSAFLGGGISGCVARNCLITSNFASGEGGGAFESTLQNCVLSSNSAINNYYFGLPATAGGACLSKLTGCAVVDNYADETGGIRACDLYNCIVYYNQASIGAQNVPLTETNFLINCCTSPLPSRGFGNISNAPLFVDQANGNFRLQSASPCVNAGNNAYAPSGLDLDGNPRIAGGTVDIGAYELLSPTSTLSYAWAQEFGLPTDGSADFEDPDGDAMTNWEEWRAGTIPTNASSLLLLLSTARSNANVVVTWQSVTNHSYFLQRASDLQAQPAFLPLATYITGQAGTTSYTDTNAAGPGPFFYRVGVQ